MMYNIQKYALMALLMLQTVLISGVSASSRNMYAEGIRAEYEGDIALAIQKHTAAFNTDSVSDAGFALGRLFRDIFYDHQKSFDWFLQAAEQGNVFAAHELGSIYAVGNTVVAVNTEKAEKWFRFAAERGKLAESAYALFRLLEENPEQSIWLVQAAEGGMIAAMEALSDAYQSGWYGIQADADMSDYWQRAALNAQE